MNTFWKIFIGLIIGYFLIIHIVGFVYIDGPSMSPTLKDTHHYIFIYHNYWYSKPKAGQIVIFKDPLTLWLNKENQGYAIKRVIATENQTVSMTNGLVYVDGKLITEKYLPDFMKTYMLVNKNPAEGVSFICHSNEYFLMGDNRTNSADSRYYGPICEKNIIGEVHP